MPAKRLKASCLRKLGKLTPNQVLEPFEDSHGRDRCYAKVMITGKGLVAIQRARLAEGAQPLVKPQHTFTNCKQA